MSRPAWELSVPVVLRWLRGALRNYSIVYTLRITRQFFNCKCLKLNLRILNWVVTHRQVRLTRRFDLSPTNYTQP
jgi:hypothetical protein